MNKNSCVLISGGSRGLGLEIVRYCLNKGTNVATCARKSSNAIMDLQQRFPETFHFESLDLRNNQSIKDFIDRLITRFGGIFGLVNNAAIGQDHLLAHLDDSQIDQIIQINLKSTIIITKYILKKMMLNREGGRILTISSICGSRGFAGLSVYSATKGALEAFTRALAREVGDRNILVNSIAPGFFNSEMSNMLTSDQIEAIKSRTPTGRITTIEDLLPVLELFLYAKTNITGQTLVVDGGFCRQ